MAQRRVKRQTSRTQDLNLTRMELFNMYRQMSDLWERAGDMYGKIPEENIISEQCYMKAGKSIEKAAGLLKLSIEQREGSLDIQYHDGENE